MPDNSLGKKSLYSELFWSVFSRIRTEYGDLLYKSPYSVQMWENADQKNSKYGLGSVYDGGFCENR